METIPAELADVLSEFSLSKRSGSVVIDIKDGSVVLIKDTRTRTVAKVDKAKQIT